MTVAQARVRSRPRPPRRGDDSALLATALARALRGRWRSYLRELRRCRARFSEEAVHDLRVAIRRLVAATDVAAAAVPGGAGGKARRRVKKLLRAFSPLRDTQVQILAVRGLEETDPRLAPVLTMLLLRERRLTTALGARIRRAETTVHGAEVEALARRVAALASRRAAARAAHAAVLAAGAEAFARAARLRESLDTGRPETVHRLRVAFKKLRYTVEMVSPTLPWVTRDLLARMNRYQTAMGEIQDAEVLDATLQAFARRKGKSPGPASARRTLRRRRGDLLRTFAARADELYAFWPVPPGAPRDVRAARRSAL